MYARSALLSKKLAVHDNNRPPVALYKGMDSPKHIKYTPLVAVVLFFVLALLPLQHFAQERKVQNRPYIDMRRWHYGFLFGLHSQDLEFVHNGYQHQLDDGTPESWYADVAAYSPGFSVGVLGELYLTQYLTIFYGKNLSIRNRNLNHSNNPLSTLPITHKNCAKETCIKTYIKNMTFMSRSI